MGGGSEASDGKYGGKKKVEEKVKNQKVTEVSNTAGLMVRYVQITEGRHRVKHMSKSRLFSDTWDIINKCQMTFECVSRPCLCTTS